jgi:hypothetical protein
MFNEYVYDDSRVDEEQEARLTTEMRTTHKKHPIKGQDKKDNWPNLVSLAKHDFYNPNTRHTQYEHAFCHVASDDQCCVRDTVCGYGVWIWCVSPLILIHLLAVLSRWRPGRQKPIPPVPMDEEVPAFQSPQSHVGPLIKLHLMQ